ncbi:MAG: extracellular solute-binding protein [Anaerolineae bacterium]
MSRHLASRRRVIAGMGVAGTAAVLAACGATPTPQVVEKIVKETVMVTSEVEKVVKETVEVVSTQVVEKEVVVTATASPKGPVKLIFFVWMAPEQQPQFQAIFDEFTSANPEISIEVQLAPGDEAQKFQKVLLMIAAGTPPDFTMGSSEAPGYAGKGLLTILDPYIEASGLDMSVFNQAILSSYLQYQGQQVVFPTVASAELLAFNPALFDAAGLSYPSDKWGDSAWDWPTFIDVATKLTVTTNGKISQFGNTGLLYYMYAVRWWGARWANDDVTSITADTAEMAEGLQELADLSLRYHVSPIQAEWEMFGDQDPLLSGMAATQSFGLWSLATYAEATTPWMAASWPVATDPLAFFYPMGLYMFTGSQNKDESWKFFEFMGTPESNLTWSQAASRMPAMPQNGPAWLEYFEAKQPNARMHVITDLLDFAGGATAEPFMIHPMYTEIMTKAVTPALDALWLGERQAKEILPELQTQIEALLKGE